MLVLCLLILAPEATAQQAPPAKPNPINDQTQRSGARKMVEEFRKTCEEIERIESGLKTVEEADLAKLQTKQRRQALAISQDYYARLFLKEDANKLAGQAYAQVTKGKGGLWRKLLAEVKTDSRLNKYSYNIMNRLKLVTNLDSLGKPGMDLDLGLLIDPNLPPEEFDRQYRQILHELGGTEGEEAFRRLLKEVTEEKYKEICKALDVPHGEVEVKRAFIEATTPYHSEAYREARVLQKQAASRQYAQQAVDVSNRKIDEMRQLVAEGVLTEEQAMIEAARGTRKDMQKMLSALDEVYRKTGVKPALSQKLDDYLKYINQVAEGADPDLLALNRLVRSDTGRDIYGLCREVMEQMHMAWALAPVGVDGLMASVCTRYLPPEAADQARKALFYGNLEDLPQGAKQLQQRMLDLLTLDLVSLDPGEPEDFLRRMRELLPDLPFEPDDKALQQLLTRLGNFPEEGLVYVVGRERAGDLRKLTGLLPPRVKDSVKIRVRAGGLSPRFMDQKARQVILDGSRGMLLFEVAVGVATAYYLTSQLMEDESLDDRERDRRITEEWVIAIPVLGDFTNAVNRATEAWYTGDVSQAAQAAMFLAMGIGYLCPATQLPAMVAGLSMVGWQLGSAALAVQRDKALVEAWVDSGEFTDQGVLKGLVCADGAGLALPLEGQEALRDFFRDSQASYHSGLPDQTIRQSVALFAGRNFLEQDRTVGVLKKSIQNLYPDFDLDQALSQPRRLGATEFWNHIRQQGQDPAKSLVFTAYRKLEEAYLEVGGRALDYLKQEAEKEYQARHYTGQALEIIQQLRALGQRLRLELVEHVDQLHNSFTSMIFKLITSPWERHSLPRQRIELARTYLEGYLKIEASLQHIKDMISAQGLEPPRQYSLTGWLEVDRTRVAGLEQAYASALELAWSDLARAARSLPDLRIDRQDPCIAEIYRELARKRLVMTAVRDWQLLAQEQAGQVQAAQQERDLALERARQRGQKGVAVPQSAWGPFLAAQAKVHAWQNIRFPGDGGGVNPAANFAGMYTRMERECLDLTAKAARRLQVCLAGLVIHLREKGTGGQEEVPVQGGRVTAMGSDGRLRDLQDQGNGDFVLSAAYSGRYRIAAQAPGYHSPEGKPSAELTLRLERPSPGQVKRAEATIHLVKASPPSLKTVYVPAGPRRPGRLWLTLEPVSGRLLPESLKAYLGQEELALEVHPHGQGLIANHSPEKAWTWGRHRVGVEVADQAGTPYRLEGSFDCWPALELTGCLIQDREGSPADGKANSGEQVGLSLTLRNHDSFPLQDLNLVLEEDDPGLKPLAGRGWTLESLGAGDEGRTNPLSFQVGEVGDQGAKAVLKVRVSARGAEMPRPLKLEVPLYPALTLDAAWAGPPRDPPGPGLPNNGDNIANPGESLTLAVRVTNHAAAGSGPHRLVLQSENPHLFLEQIEFAVEPLGPGAGRDYTLQARVYPRISQDSRAEVKAQLIPQGRDSGRTVELPLPIRISPLLLSVKNLFLEDPPKPGDPAAGDGNGRLSPGETGYLTITLASQEPADLPELYLDLSLPGRSGAVSQPRAEALRLAAGGEASRTFTLKLPPDQAPGRVNLVLKAISPDPRRQWSAEIPLDIEERTQFRAELVLVEKMSGWPVPLDSLTSGMELTYRLDITGQGGGDTGEVGLQFLSYDVDSLSIRPNQFSGLSFGPGTGGVQRVSGTLKVSPTPRSDRVPVVVTLSQGRLELLRQNFQLGLAAQKVKMDLRPTEPPPGGKSWTIEVLVLTLDGRPVEQGVVTLDVGGRGSGPLELNQGRAAVRWTPTEFKLTRIEALYSGDQVDPARKDLRYLPQRLALNVTPRPPVGPVTPEPEPGGGEKTAPPEDGGDGPCACLDTEAQLRQWREVDALKHCRQSFRQRCCGARVELIHGWKLVNNICKMTAKVTYCVVDPRTGARQWIKWRHPLEARKTTAQAREACGPPQPPLVKPPPTTSPPAQPPQAKPTEWDFKLEGRAERGLDLPGPGLVTLTITWTAGKRVAARYRREGGCRSEARVEWSGCGSGTLKAGAVDTRGRARASTVIRVDKGCRLNLKAVGEGCPKYIDDGKSPPWCNCGVWTGKADLLPGSMDVQVQYQGR